MRHGDRLITLSVVVSCYHHIGSLKFNVYICMYVLLLFPRDDVWYYDVTSIYV